MLNAHITFLAWLFQTPFPPGAQASAFPLSYMHSLGGSYCRHPELLHLVNHRLRREFQHIPERPKNRLHFSEALTIAKNGVRIESKKPRPLVLNTLVSLVRLCGCRRTISTRARSNCSLAREEHQRGNNLCGSALDNKRKSGCDTSAEWKKAILQRSRQELYQHEVTTIKCDHSVLVQLACASVKSSSTMNVNYFQQRQEELTTLSPVFLSVRSHCFSYATIECGILIGGRW